LVPDNDQIPPSAAHIAGEDDNAVADRVNGSAEIFVATVNAIPILAQVTSRTEAARFVVVLCVWFPDREVETVGEADLGGGTRGRGDEADNEAGKKTPE
jgi:hypothetical protein